LGGTIAYGQHASSVGRLNSLTDVDSYWYILSRVIPLQPDLLQACKESQPNRPVSPIRAIDVGQLHAVKPRCVSRIIRHIIP
jgi:hypothetical protein